MNKILICLFCISLNSCIPNLRDEWVFPEIKGYVFDSLTNLPIRNAIVFEKYHEYNNVQSDSNGFFEFKAKKRYERFRLIAMDVKPFMELRFEKTGYEPKEIVIKYIQLVYGREKPDTFDLKIIKLKKNVP
jgi:hypothetical protein